VAEITLDKQTRETLSRRLADHLGAEFDVEVAPFDAQALLDYLAKTLGPYFYNQGLYDAQAILKDRAEALSDAIAAIEKPLPR